MHVTFCCDAILASVESLNQGGKVNSVQDDLRVVIGQDEYIRESSRAKGIVRLSGS